MFCYRCGNQLPEDSTFCNRCGTRVRTTLERMRRQPARSQPLPEDYYLEEEEDFRPRRRPARDVEDPYEPDEEEYPEEDEEGYYDEEEEEEWVEEEVEAHDGKVYHGSEHLVFSINPAFYPVTTAYIISTFFSLIVAALVAYFRGPFWLVLTASIIFFTPSIIRHIKHLHTVFTLTNIKLEISQGLFAKSTQNIPLRNIQDVSVRETFKERILGIGDIIIFTANDQTNVTMNNINDPRKYADLILDQLQRWN